MAPLKEANLEIVNLVFHLGNLSGGGLSGGFRSLVEASALLGGPFKSLCHHLRADRALAHLLFQFGYALAGLLADHLQRVEPRVDHLQQILTHQLAGATHLRERQCQRLHLLFVAQGDVADVLQLAESIFSV